MVKPPETSPIREMLRRVERGEDILSLAAGEARFEPPGELLHLASRAMVDGKNSYCSTEGIPSLRHAIVDFAGDAWGTRVDADTELLVTVGCMEAISLAVSAVVAPGDRVLIPDPGWGVVRSLVTRIGAQVDTYPIGSRGTFCIDPKEIVDRLDRPTRLVYVNSPSNPTGAALNPEGWSAVLEAVARAGTTVLSDESYHNYVYEGEHASALSAEALDHLILVSSFSKTFAVTGWRVGYAMTNSATVRRMSAIKETTSLCSPSTPQWAIAEFLPVSEGYRAHARELCRQNMERVVERLQTIPGVRCAPPAGGFYAFPDVSEIDPSSQQLTTRLLDGGVAVIPGDFFGPAGEGHIRVGFASDYESISRAMDRLEAVLRST